MRVAIVGAGGMGGFFGAMLARGGHAVTFIARGDRLRAIGASGLQVSSPVLGDFSVRVAATDEPARVGRVDLVMVCVKTYDVGTVAPSALPLVGTGTLVVPVQNGVDAPDQLAAVLGREPVLGGISWVTAHSPAPGQVAHVRSTRLVLGEPFLSDGASGTSAGQPSTRTRELAAALVDADIAAEVSPDIRAALWEKLMGICVVAGLAGVTRLPLGPMFASAELRDVARQMLDEIALVARVHGVHLAEDAAAQSLAMLEGIAQNAPSAYPSLYEDLVHGRKLELDALTGSVARLGRESNVPTPINALITALLSPYQAGSPRFSSEEGPGQ